MVERNCNALMALIISCVLWGALGIQFFKHEQPCALCLMQRLGMLGITFGALLNLKFGIQRAHYSLSLLSAMFGAFVSLRHIALHVCPGFPAFGEPFWGLSLYVWALIVFASSIVYISLLMFFRDERKKTTENTTLNWLGQLAFFSVFLVALINIFTTLWQCGLGDCEI